MNKDNYTMLCDFYEFVMCNGYLKSGLHNDIVYFDVFFRTVPDNGGFAIFAGLEQVIEYINNLHFSNEDLDFLRSKNLFCEEFLEYLKAFKFNGDIYSMPEGTPIFPGEPVMTVRATAIQAQFIETYVLLMLNHQSLIATKANRITRAAGDIPVYEFGARRSQGANAALLGARAAYIGGCEATSCSMSGLYYDIPTIGTMAHSWVQMFEDEYTAFKVFCQSYPLKPVLLVDTYDVLKSGVPNAIKVFKEVMLAKGLREFAIRIDSGDISYLSKKARKMLDKEGLYECKIIVSNSLNEDIIRDLISQDSKTDAFGVGEHLITSSSTPVFGFVYKLVAKEDNNGNIIPKIKISENPAKITTPHFKKVYRLFEKSSSKAIADLVCLNNEYICETNPLELFDPNFTWKRKVVKDFTAVELLKPIFINGKLVYKSPGIKNIRNYCKAQIELLWDETKRFENPHKYYVDLSRRLWKLKNELLSSSMN